MPGGGGAGNSSNPSESAHSASRSRAGAGFSSAGMNTVCWPKRTPCFRSSARPS